MIGPVAFRPSWLRHWGDDPWSFNLSSIDEDGEDVEGSGMPGRALVAGAVLTWARTVPSATPEMVATVFNIPLGFAVDALRPDLYHPSELAEAVQMWSLLLGGEVAVGLASATFAVPPVVIVSLVHDHHYMFMDMRGGVMCIGHEGE